MSDGPSYSQIVSEMLLKSFAIIYFQFFETSDWYFGSGGPEIFEKNQCKVTNCFITHDR
jgi:hypothetical protein